MKKLYLCVLLAIGNFTLGFSQNIYFSLQYLPPPLLKRNLQKRIP
jgi:hypothetical protein